MSRYRNRNKLPVFPLLCLALIPSAAFAYLDPATGSMVLQIVVGGFLATAATVKIYWRKIRGLFGRQEKASANEKGYSR